MRAPVLIACLIALVPAAASAASHDIKIFITEYDLNHDGSVSKEEFADEREHRFIVTDVNHDAGLSHEEYVGEYKARITGESAEPKNLEKQLKQADVRFNVLDSNKDGRISRAEYASSGWSMFVNHDYTKDGAISGKDDVEPAAPARREGERPQPNQPTA
jgi:Ca2+-binding EF-hand superfamily protein